MATALITGASAGLGAEFARQLAAKQYNLVLVARRNDKLQTLARSLTEAHPGINVYCVTTDLSEIDAPAYIQSQITQLNLHIDFLINNAGAGGQDLLDGGDWRPHRAYQQLMMNSVAELCHRFIPPMCEQGTGYVINVSSVAGRLPRANDCHYGPAKAYLVALSESLALTVKNEGVNVCALCPGFTHTDFHLDPDLAEMKRNTPAFIWYDTDVVVREGLDAVAKGKTVQVSGRLYRWLDPFIQSKIIRRLLVRMM